MLSLLSIFPNTFILATGITEKTPNRVPGGRRAAGGTDTTQSKVKEIAYCAMMR